MSETRTLTAYQCFFKESFADLKAKQEKKLKGKSWSSADTTVVVKTIGEQWRGMSAVERKKYEGKATVTVKPKASKKRKASAEPEAAAEPVERTLSAYQCFFRETFAKLKAAQVKKLRGKTWQSTDTQVVVKQVAQEWRGLSDAQKQKFVGKATTMIKPKKAKKSKKVGKTRKLTAYNMFVTENSKGKGSGAAQRMKEIGEKWKNMSDKNKAAYQKEADKHNASNASSTTKEL